MDEAKVQRVSGIIGFIIGLGISIGLAAIFKIDATQEYGWWGGIWQSWLFVPHWILSWFNGDILLRAAQRTTGYNIFFWIFIVCQGYYYLNILINIIRLLFRR